MREPPLHVAVLDDCYEKLEELSQDLSAREEKNRLGFTALELAQLLGKEKSIKILELHHIPRVIQIMSKGAIALKKYHPKQFADFFGIRYQRYLHFANYDLLKQAIRNCPWILKSWLGKENWELGDHYRQEIQTGYVANTIIQWIDREMGYGLFAGEDLDENTFIGEYTGKVRRLHRWHPDHNAYCFHYPTCLWSWKYFIIDAVAEGNETRFINHSATPNLKPICLVDRGLLHLVFLTAEPISKGMQLTFDYGPDFWKKRAKEQT